MIENISLDDGMYKPSNISWEELHKILDDSKILNQYDIS
jgi:hypothetical protein